MQYDYTAPFIIQVIYKKDHTISKYNIKKINLIESNKYFFKFFKKNINEYVSPPLEFKYINLLMLIKKFGFINKAISINLNHQNQDKAIQLKVNPILEKIIVSKYKDLNIPLNIINEQLQQHIGLPINYQAFIKSMNIIYYWYKQKGLSWIIIRWQKKIEKHKILIHLQIDEGKIDKIIILCEDSKRYQSFARVQKYYLNNNILNELNICQNNLVNYNYLDRKVKIIKQKYNLSHIYYIVKYNSKLQRIVIIIKYKTLSRYLEFLSILKTDIDIKLQQTKTAISIMYSYILSLEIKLTMICLKMIQQIPFLINVNQNSIFSYFPSNILSQKYKNIFKNYIINIFINIQRYKYSLKQSLFIYYLCINEHIVHVKSYISHLQITYCIQEQLHIIHKFIIQTGIFNYKNIRIIKYIIYPYKLLYKIAFKQDLIKINKNFRQLWLYNDISFKWTQNNQFIPYKNSLYFQHIIFHSLSQIIYQKYATILCLNQVINITIQKIFYSILIYSAQTNLIILIKMHFHAKHMYNNILTHQTFFIRTYKYLKYHLLNCNKSHFGSIKYEINVLPYKYLYFIMHYRHNLYTYKNLTNQNMQYSTSTIGIGLTIQIPLQNITNINIEFNCNYTKQKYFRVYMNSLFIA